jgi:hypothetical protein
VRLIVELDDAIDPARVELILAALAVHRPHVRGAVLQGGGGGVLDAPEVPVPVVTCGSNGRPVPGAGGGGGAGCGAGSCGLGTEWWLWPE